jgi:transposase
MKTAENPPFVPFPPAGWVTNREAARMLGVGLETLTMVGWKWRPMLRGAGKCVRPPGGGRCGIYPIDQIERIAAAQAAAAVRPEPPPGFVDKDGACRMFGVTRHVWKTWIRQGKVGFGQLISSRFGGRQRLYKVEDLERLREELFGEDKLYKGADGHYHVPAEFIGREEACAKFGVSISIWWRWEREGKITCGQRVPGGPKLYKVEDIYRMLDEYGKYCPPYPDADRPGVFRVPLSGRDIRRREALVDAGALPLIEGGSCSWSPTDDSGCVLFSRGDVHSSPLRRMILGVTEDGLNVRHRNGDPLDCRRENLVTRTIAQRVRNARKMKAIKGRPPTSRFKGVHWERQTKGWRARIGMDGKTRQLGRFRDEIAAAVAYDEAARQWFGEHARLNFPDGVDARLEKEAAEAEQARLAA